MQKSRFNIPEALTDSKTYKKRSGMSKMFDTIWAESKKGIENKKFEEAIGYMPKKFYYCSDEKWRNHPFGAVGTLEEAGCSVFTAQYIIDSYGIKCGTITELADEIAQKNYRCWKFENFLKVFSSYKVTMEEAKQVLPAEFNIDCFEEAIAVTGKAVGVGGRQILFDNIIAKVNGVEPVRDTRLVTIDEAIKILKNGGLVPVRLENEIYHDPTRKGGHYAILIAIVDGMAKVLDSSEECGIRTLPATQLFQATTVAWKVV